MSLKTLDQRLSISNFRWQIALGLMLVCSLGISQTMSDTSNSFDLAQEYYGVNEYLKALGICKQIVLNDSVNQEALYLLVQIYEELDSVNQEKKLLHTAIDCFPFNEEFIFRYGKVLMSEEKYDEAITTFERVLDILLFRRAQNPLIANSYFKIGIAHFATNNYQEAIDAFTENLKHYSYNPRATFFNRGLAYQKSEQLSKACQDWENANIGGFEPARKMILKYCQN